MFPDRLVEKARKIPEAITPTLDRILNRNTLLTMGGITTFIGLGLLGFSLYQNGVDLGIPRGSARLIAILPPALPIFKGVLGNAKEYFFSGKILSVPESREDQAKMVTAGLSMHFAGEYTQILAETVGGSDFHSSFLSPDLSLAKFLFDPHNLPYWSLNIPGFFLIGKPVLSSMRNTVNNVIENIRIVRSLAKKE